MRYSIRHVAVEAEDPEVDMTFSLRGYRIVKVLESNCVRQVPEKWYLTLLVEKEYANIKGRP